MSTALSATQQTPFRPNSPEAADWKRQLAEHLEAYRAKHGDSGERPMPAVSSTSANPRAASIARVVASRYAEAPSYSEMMRVAEARERQRLAEEAAWEEEQLQQARLAEARRVEAMQAEAARQPQEAPQHFPSFAQEANYEFDPRYDAEQERGYEMGSGRAAGDAAPSPQRQTGTAVMPQFAERNQEMHLHLSAQDPEPSLEDLLAASVVEPPAYLPSKLIEFPRELVSAHRAKLRPPEMQMREQAGAVPPPADASQLRIFEVQAQAEPGHTGDTELESAQAVNEAAKATDDHAMLAGAMLHSDSPQGSMSGSIGDSQVDSRNRSRNGSWNGAMNESRAEPVTDAAPGYTQNPVNGSASDQPRAKFFSRHSGNEGQTAAAPSHRAGSREGVAANYSTNNVSRAAERAGAPTEQQWRVKPNSPPDSRPISSPNSRSGVPSGPAFQGLEWAAISLDREPENARREAAANASEYAPFLVEPASIDRRVMAMAVDFSLVTGGFLGFLLVFAASTPHIPTGMTAAVLSAVVYIALWTLYQLLFFSLSGATAGMLYARIALCSFEDQNPTRPELRRRLAVWWLSCLPLGLGFFWSFVDEDNLCWHDRITRTYLRGY